VIDALERAGSRAGDFRCQSHISHAGEFCPGNPAEAFHAENPYLESVLGFIGVTAVRFFQAVSTLKIDRGEKTLA
jgi:FMN-dependent NADH-azoreductase